MPLATRVISMQDTKGSQMTPEVNQGLTRGCRRQALRVKLRWTPESSGPPAAVTLVS
jgi:hypothetical protein